MPALKLNTQATAQGATAPKPPLAPVPAPAPAPAPVAPTTTTTITTTTAAPATAPAPEPAPATAPATATSSSSRNPTPAHQPQAGSSTGTSSGPEPAAPVPEPLSPQFRPISTTPIPPPTIPSFASGRQALTHREHPAQVESAPQPAPQQQQQQQQQQPADEEGGPPPVDFRDNVDVIALESAILLLQRQKRQAEEDIRHLRRVKEEAIARPSDFVRDLATGRVGGGGGGSGGGQQAAGRGAAGGVDDDDEDSDDDESGDGNAGEASDNGLKPSPMEVPASGKGKAAAGSSSNPPAAAAAVPQPSWTTLPKPQDVVRMPAINWSKYAVVGESLDKLHNEQLARPTLGTPGVVGANGTYEFKGGPNPDDGKWVGVSAPYDPLKDKLKSKGVKRAG